MIGIFWGAITGNFDPSHIEGLALHYDTINPIQWITAAFLHAGFGHLIGNMLFLWVFGLVIEGKIGSLAFTALYFALTAIDGGSSQILLYLFGGEGSAVGASGTIFALMVIALIWAPENCIEVLLVVFVLMRALTHQFEVRIVTVAGLFIAQEAIVLYLDGFQISSALFHLHGATVGMFAGFFMLRRDMVDCEDWDIVARNDWLQKHRLLCTEDRHERLKNREEEEDDSEAIALAGRHSLVVQSTNKSGGVGSSKKKHSHSKNATKRQPQVTETQKENRRPGLAMPRSKSEKTPPPKSLSELSEPKKPSDTCRAHPDYNRLSFLLRQALEKPSVVMAEHHFDDLRKKNLIEGLADSTLKAYIKLMSSSGQYLATLMPLHVLADRGGEQADRARLQIAQVQLKVMKTPVEASKTLEKIERRVKPNSETSDSKMMERWKHHQKVLQQKEILLQQCQQSQ